MKLLFKKAKNKAGFTLLEALIAITILIFALVATMTAARSGLASAYESRDQVIAFYLAQEAVEYIRNVRDNNSLMNSTGATTHWLNGISELAGDPCYPGKKCLIDVVSAQISSCTTPTTCTNLRQDTSSKMYGHTITTWPFSQFKREISIQHIDINREAVITVIITWPKGSFEVREVVFNWQT